MPGLIKCELCGSVDQKVRYRLDGFDTVECCRCHLVFNKIRLAREDLKELYSKDYFEERRNYFFDNVVADPGHGHDSLSIRDFRDGLAVVQQFRQSRKGKILDVGCAIGVFLSIARETGWEARGIDVSEYAARYAREKFGLDVIAGDLPDAHFPDREFDVVTLWDVFEHLPNPTRQLREIHRIMKDDGLLLLDTPNERGLLREIAHLVYWASGGRIAYPARKLHHIFHLYYYSPETLGHMVEAAGFELAWQRRKSIPPVKARGSRTEKLIVRAFSQLEKLLGREYEIMIVARKMPRPSAARAAV